jgi:hypothetical protein
MNKPTIKQLRQSGYKVRVMHTRDYILDHTLFGLKRFLNPKGGSTRIELTSPDKKYDVFGEAKCSEKDRFNRKLGNEIALNRAINKVCNLSK